MLDVFTSTGAIREPGDFSDEEIKGLPEDRQEQFAELVSANETMQAAERKHSEAQAGVVSAVRVSQDADSALANSRPVLTHLDLVRATSEAQRTGVGVKPDPVIEKRMLAAAAVADDASAAVAKARRARSAADVEVKRARVVFSKALFDWVAELPKLDQKDLIAHVATTQAERALAEKALIEAKPASHLDQVLKNSHGRRGRAVEHPNGRRLAR
jgi:hypothetical protein